MWIYCLLLEVTYLDIEVYPSSFGISEVANQYTFIRLVII